MCINYSSIEHVIKHCILRCFYIHSSEVIHISINCHPPESTFWWFWGGRWPYIYIYTYLYICVCVCVHRQFSVRKRGSAVANTSPDQWISTYQVAFCSPFAGQFFEHVLVPRRCCVFHLMCLAIYQNPSFWLGPNWVTFIFCPKVEYVIFILGFLLLETYAILLMVVFSKHMNLQPPTWPHSMQPGWVNLQPQQEVDSWRSSKVQKWNRSRKRMRTQYSNN